MHTNNSFNLQDLYATFSEKFSEQKHYALALWLEAVIKALESQGFSLDDTIFALSEVLHARGFKEASGLLEQTTSSILSQSRRDNGRD